jgi:hypothetical protein
MPQAASDRKARVLTLYRDHYPDFDIRHFHQLAWRQHHVRFCYAFVNQQQARTSALSGSRPHHQHPGPQATGENAQSREARPVGERAELVRRIGAPH